MALVCASPPSRAGATQAAGAALFADGRALSVGVPGGNGGSVGKPVGNLVGALLATTGGGLRGAGAAFSPSGFHPVERIAR
jgi:hypothetical protein